MSVRSAWLIPKVAFAICLLCLFGVASEAHAASITEFKLHIALSGPRGIAAGADGNLWFTENAGDRVGRITPAGAITDWSTGSGISSDSAPLGIAAGPDGNLWFTEEFASRIGRMSPSTEHATEFSAGITPPADSSREALAGITAGPDGNLWFAEQQQNRIARITPAGVVTEFSTGLGAGSAPTGITRGPDGNIWFTEEGVSRIGRITPSGTISETSLGITPHSVPDEITAGPDGNLWFTEQEGNRIGRITPAGVVTEFSAGLSDASEPTGITAGPDGNLWFTEHQGNRIGRITPTGTITEFSTGLSPGSEPEGIVTGPDQNLWFAEFSGNSIGRLSLDPLATTGSASALGATGESLAGTVTPYGSRTSYVFQYGRTTAYGTVTGSQTIAPGRVPVAVSARIGGLQPNTLYHYRLVASSAAGTSNGADQTFTTASSGGGSPPPPPPPRTGPPIGILTATLSTAKSIVKIKLSCPLAETLGCHGRVRIKTTGKHAARLGSASFRIGGGQTKTIAILLTRHGRARLNGNKTRIRVLVTGIDASGNAATTIKSLRLRRQ